MCKRIVANSDADVKYVRTTDWKLELIFPGEEVNQAVVACRKRGGSIDMRCRREFE
jgi:hypothetical protein